MEDSGLRKLLTKEQWGRMVSGKHPRSVRNITPSKWTKPHSSTEETLPNKYDFLASFPVLHLSCGMKTGNKATSLFASTCHQLA